MILFIHSGFLTHLLIKKENFYGCKIENLILEKQIVFFLRFSNKQ